MEKKILENVANVARSLAFDAIKKSNSGHLGLPLGVAEIGAVLFSDFLSFNPNHPKWINRDRFVLSAGHGSMFLYAWLHLSGYDISLDDIKNFRQLNSITPGHPEFGITDGVESTTGPLGQGFGNGIGYAIAGKKAAMEFNTKEHEIFNNKVIIFASDGDIQEGVCYESASFAGHNCLDNLIVIYDANDVTLDSNLDKTFSEDVASRFRACSWEVEEIDGHDIDQIKASLQNARENKSKKPRLIIAKTKICYGIDEVAQTAAGHGEGGTKFEESFRKKLNLSSEKFFVPESVKDFFKEKRKDKDIKYSKWEKNYKNWRNSNPKLANKLDKYLSKTLDNDLLTSIPEFSTDYNKATRVSGGEVMQHIAKSYTQLLTGSADLFGSTKNYIKSSSDFGKDNFDGRNIWYGIREHAMSAILNGISYDSLYIASGATFASFTGYMMPSIRLAALSNLQTIYIYTHDSIGVGEDGPTHQPVENMATLRAVPNLDVIRPADPEEVVGAFVAAIRKKNGPTAIFLTRQNVSNLNSIPVNRRREGVIDGGYIAKKEADSLKLILISCGSELELVLEAANHLEKNIGDHVRVVSMPCMERFDKLSKKQRDEILPPKCDKRIAVEAGVDLPWHKYVGLNGITLCMNEYGVSAPGDVVFEKFGFSVENIIKISKELI